MTPFLAEVAEKIYKNNHRSLDAVTLVFPNRRAILYFRKHVSSLLDKPAFSPRLLTIEDFIGGFSLLIIPDKLQLIHCLYNVYHEVVQVPSASENDPEPFDQFYFWGDMLLRDFDEVDKYLIKAEHLFKDLSHQKELDSSFDYLTEEQKTFLQNFWSNFDLRDSAHKKKFMYIWQQLYDVYTNFQQRLKKLGWAYEGMLHREVAENCSTLTHPYAHQTLSFVGFNAFTKAEEIIITHFVEHFNASVYWDVDAYYIHNATQEAGRFFRDYQQHPVLGKTFPPDIPAYFRMAKQIKLYGAAQPVGQAKLMAQVLREKLGNGFKPEETIVVLPDEKLLMPVLHGIADNGSASGSREALKMNVTMGFPLVSTPVFNLVELLIELQINRKDDHFNHRSVLALLGHPYVTAADPVNANTKRKEILYGNWVNIPQRFLATTVPLHVHIFKRASVGQLNKPDSVSLLQYLKNIITETGSLHNLSALDKEYCFHFLKLFNRMEEVLSTSFANPTQEEPHNSGVTRGQLTKERNALKSFLRLFRQITRSEKIPFAGEPLAGLQVMGVLETRNLDFKNVFILSLNEGAFPSFNTKGSYIPHNIRQAYRLPVTEHQDAMYAYLFYRMLQRSENVFLFYNSETDVLGQGEMSRYLQQLLFESGLVIEKQVLHNTIHPKTVTPIVVKKDARVFESLARHCLGERTAKELTPSSLNDYIECRLKFYFRYVAGIREPREVEEDLDARLLGSFLHRIMEIFYRQIIDAKKSNAIELSDFNNYSQRIDRIIDQVFIHAYKLDPNKKVNYEGQRLVVREVVKRFVDKIITMDKDYAPFTIDALERKDVLYSIKLDVDGNPEILLGGVIDRADRKGDVLRIIDYKTGKDLLSFDGVESLFNREGRRNKAAFQTMLYALLYKKNLSTNGVKLIPGLLNRVNLFDEDFTFGLRKGKEIMQDATPLLPEFEDHLKKLLEEIYNAEENFDQTQNTDVCQYCSYRGICYR